VSIERVVEAVTACFMHEPAVLQVVAVPMFASFPKYAFFLLHRKQKGV
jgi:hypothetical protein